MLKYHYLIKITEIREANASTKATWDGITGDGKPQDNADVTRRSSTVTIAAHNSSTSGKSGADYVCDGVEDEITIQEAIDNLSFTGGTLLLLEGDYHLDDFISLPPRSVIKGVGQATRINTTGMSISNRYLIQAKQLNTVFSRVANSGDNIIYSAHQAGMVAGDEIELVRELFTITYETKIIKSIEVINEGEEEIEYINGNWYYDGAYKEYKITLDSPLEYYYSKLNYDYEINNLEEGRDIEFRDLCFCDCHVDRLIDIDGRGTVRIENVICSNIEIRDKEMIKLLNYEDIIVNGLTIKNQKLFQQVVAEHLMIIVSYI
jgi:hypothetical protein